MLIDWFIYWLLIWGLVATLNASVFKKQPASRTTAWVLTIGMFFVNLLALTVLTCPASSDHELLEKRGFVVVA